MLQLASEVEENGPTCLFFQGQQFTAGSLDSVLLVKQLLNKTSLTSLVQEHTAFKNSTFWKQAL